MNKTIQSIKSSRNIRQLEELFDSLCDKMFDYFENLTFDEKRRYLVSMSNYTESLGKTTCAPELGLLQHGDICLVEMGCAYTHELSYAHVGIILSQMNGKSEILPIITGGDGDYERAYHPTENKDGVDHLIRIHAQSGIYHNSVGLVTDVKWLSCKRVIAVYSNIAGTEEFDWICKRVDEVRKLGRTTQEGEKEETSKKKGNRYYGK